MALAVQVQAQSFLTNGLVAFYPFNGNANDASGNGNNGIFVPATSMSGGPTLTSNHLGVANSAYSFNSGSYVYAIVTNLPLANSARTISGWIKLNASSTSSEESVASWGYGDNNAGDCTGAAFGLWANFYAVNNGQNLYSWGSFNDVSAPYDFDFSTFYFVADTYDGKGNVTLFVNGAAIAQENIGGYNTFTNNYLLRMGVSTHAPDWNNDYLDGSLDDIRIYNRALATNEIAQLYAIESAPNRTILLQDNFNLTALNTNTLDVDFQLAQRQTGILAPVTYTKGLEPTFSQVGNPTSPVELLLAGRAAGMGGAVSLDHDFIESPGLGSSSVIEFDVNPVQIYPGFNETETSWVAVTFGSSSASRNSFPQFVDGMGILFRGNRQYQAFNAGQDVGTNTFAPNADNLFHHIRITLTETTYGNPFSGTSPVIVNAFVDGNPAPFFSFVRTNGFTQNYISLVGEGEGSGGDGVVRHLVDNLAISLEPVSRPEMSLVLSGGNASLSWPTYATGYQVYTASNLVAPVFWSPLTNTVRNQGTNYSVTAHVSGQKAFFRLQVAP